MNENYTRCAECGKLVLADSVGWACQECIGEIESDKPTLPASVQVINRLFQDLNDLMFGKESK